MELLQIEYIKQIIFSFVLSLFFMGQIFSTETKVPSSPGYILYLMQIGDTSRALKTYREYCEETKTHDFELLQEMGLILLDQGYRSRDKEIQMLALFGAGTSLNEKTLYILEDGLSSHLPQLQLISLNFLARYQNDRADEAINRALASNFLLIRLEAAYQLAEKKSPTAVGQTESLMAKVDKSLLPLFPQFYGLIGDPASIKIMRKLLTNSRESVRVETILSAAKNGRDDLLPYIRRMALQHHFAQQEACATALGVLKDESSISKLEKLAESSSGYVKLAALRALYSLGKEQYRAEIETMAKEKNLFAIAMLGSLTNSESLLADLLEDTNVQVKTNVTIALLERKDPRCLLSLCDLLIRDSRDLMLLKTNSPGKSLSCWKVVSSAFENFKDTPEAFELSLSLREDLLLKAMKLPHKDFLRLAHAMFESEQNDLIPALTQILENLDTPGAIKLLKRHQQKAGAPLVRNYCNLALYRLKQEGPYGDNLRSWVAQQQNLDLIRFRPLVPLDLRESATHHFELTPQETSRLLIEAFESFVVTQDDLGIDLLISIIENGNSKNKYALIGLLMRATQ